MRKTGGESGWAARKGVTWTNQCTSMKLPNSSILLAGGSLSNRLDPVRRTPLVLPMPAGSERSTAERHAVLFRGARRGGGISLKTVATGKFPAAKGTKPPFAGEPFSPCRDGTSHEPPMTVRGAQVELRRFHRSDACSVLSGQWLAADECSNCPLTFLPGMATANPQPSMQCGGEIAGGLP